MAGTADHAREIERALSGAITPRDDFVLRSWKRCVDQHGLDPARPTQAYVVTDSELRRHREQSQRLIQIARSGLENLFKQVAGQNYVLLLADAKGVTVDYLGDPSFLVQLRAAGLCLGSEWSETRTGTCGIGSCIATGEAISVHQTDHFDPTHTALSCTAAPIFDTGGQLTAVLDISLLRSPQPKVSQNLALHLVTASARRIELANLMAHMRSDWVLQFSRSPEFLDVDPEAAIALDGSGRILGMTHGGAVLLAQMAAAPLPRGSSPIGQPLSRFLDLGVDDLPTLTRARPPEERLVWGRNGSALFAHAIEPQARIAHRAPVLALPGPIEALSGGDARVASMQARAAKLARADLPILIQGESGTGKECLARALHDSARRSGPFIAVNCAAIPEHLIESELFGHVAGAFTGAAAKGRKGLIEAADGGTLFLDEIGDMPLTLQSRLLRVLAEREVIPVGAVAPRKVDIRIVSASHRDLGRMVAQGQFREDLFYRLNAAALALPPLRERSDFEWLLDRLLAERNQRSRRRLRLSAAARLVLIRHSWPGNIRELANALDLAMTLCDGDTIEPGDLPDFAPVRALATGPAGAMVGGVVGAAVDGVVDGTAERIEGGQIGRPGADPAAEPQDGAVRQAASRPATRGATEEGALLNEHAELRAALIASAGNISESARRLGVDRSTIHRRMKRLGLKAKD